MNQTREKIRPDEATLKLYRQMGNLIGRNADSIADDFEQSYASLTLAEIGAADLTEAQKQALTNIMFGSFVNGLITAISPQSHFNEKFVGPEKQNAAEPQT